MESQNKLILGYWNIRGLGGVLHCLLNVCNIPYEEHVYSQREDWFGQTKDTINLDYPNLPYIIDGDKNISETLALMHYVVIKGNRKDLLGGSEENHCKVLEACCVVNDMRAELIALCWTRGDFAKDRDVAFGQGRIKGFLTKLNKNLEGKDWLAGSFSIADFWLLEHLDIIHEIDNALLEPYPHLVSFRKRFLERPEIQAFRKTDKFIKLIFWPGAHPTWNNYETSK